MSLQSIIVQLTAEMERHKPVYRPWFNKAIHSLEHVILAEDDYDDYIKSPASEVYGHEANLPVFRSPGQ